MKRSLINASILAILGLGAVMSTAAQAETINLDLCAGEYVIDGSVASPGPVGNTAPITMWGYALGSDADDPCAGVTYTSPGPSILLPNNKSAGQYDLNITLHNRLPRATSLVIPGLFKPMTPVMFDAPDGSSRVHSFDAEAAPGGSVPYTWNNITAGSYLYQSGTHQQIQVQMGLVGALLSDSPRDGGPRLAYEGLPYTDLFPLIYSEIDPAIHAGVVAGDYNTTDMKSTINYAPKYFGITLDTINGGTCPEDNHCVQELRSSTFEGDQTSLLFASGKSPLFRLFNGSTRIHTPTLIGGNFDIVAEDGNLYPSSRRQYAVALPPLKTKDAVLDTSAIGAAGGVIKLIDSAMNLSNPAPGVTGYAVGAMADEGTIVNGEASVFAEFRIQPSPNYTYLAFNQGSSPVAKRDEITVLEGSSISINVIANDELNGASIELVNAPKHGSVVATATGFDYTHDGSEGDTDALLYRLVKSGEPSSMAGVKIAVTQLNDAPVANDDSLSLKVGQTYEVRVLDNDTDAEGKAALRVTDVDASAFADFGTVSFVDKAVTIMASAESAGAVNVGYTISDGQGGNASANISVTVTAGNNAGGDFTGNDNADTEEEVTTGMPPIANDDAFSVAEGGTYTVDTAILSVLANDVANGGKVEMDEYPEHGSIDMTSDGLFTYTHNGDEDEEDHFKYTIYNQWGSDTAEVKVTVTAKMDAPRVNPDRASVKAGQPKVIDVLKNDRDHDSDVRKATIEIVKSPSLGTVTIGADNKITYTPNDGARGKDEFSYRLYDDITGEKSRKVGKVKVRVK